MQPERPPLPDQPVQQQRRLLGELVVLDEELLEFVHHEQDPRRHLVRPGGPVARQVVHPGRPELLPPLPQQAVEPLEDAQPELPLALDGHHPGVRQPVLGVPLELDALLEVDQV